MIDGFAMQLLQQLVLLHFEDRFHVLLLQRFSMDEGQLNLALKIPAGLCMTAYNSAYKEYIF